MKSQKKSMIKQELQEILILELTTNTKIKEENKTTQIIAKILSISWNL
jgi:hypothetical protein